MKLLDEISEPGDVKRLDISQLNQLCDEVRRFFINTILHHGGHFAGNLGVVEITVALHYVFDFDSDKLIWDVGHQSYIHKILSGRKNLIQNIRDFGGISGFPKMSESNWDHFGTGHSSTSISAALGMATAAALKGEKSRKIIAVVGDGALTGGMSFEGLNNVAAQNPNLLIVVNDNQIGIDPNTGAMHKHLQEINEGNPGFFKSMQIPYTGPENGHDVEKLVTLFNKFKSESGPGILHLKTVKGKGFADAESEQTRWHSTSKYVKIESGTVSNSKKWQDVFGDTLTELATQNHRVVGITPAMPSGSGMIKTMQQFPDRFFDVGIAEQHAVTFAAGLAVEGLIPYLNIYSTFLQRGYDQLIHDVALQNIPVIFCIDRAGFVGEDGPTHHGSFDIAYLNCIPDLILTAPANFSEFTELLKRASESDKPFCIRYPKGNEFRADSNKNWSLPETGKCIQLIRGENTALISTGITTEFCIQAIRDISANASLYHFPYIKPVDQTAVKNIASKYKAIITVEDGCIKGGFGESFTTLLHNSGFRGKITHLGIPDQFVTQGDNQKLYEICGYSVAKIATALNDATV